ncbi:MAG: hypothetical protein JSS02_01415, partial [Planctomycetes bacterium]|nr:hypothetical protein [Planctomycetota bacterium]
MNSPRSWISLVVALAIWQCGVLQADDPKPGSPQPPEEEAETPNVHRPATPAVPPDPEELQNRPVEGGKLRFNFHGQPWPAVIEWLADISHLSLDWQELPSGFVNLRTEREYTLDEARDLINRQLLDRGFTMLKDGEILSVVPIKKLDPSLVPWMKPEELAAAQPHDFVRVVFALETLSAEAAASELKSLLSPNGKLSPLKSTNRIEVMDAVINLRQIQKLLVEEQSAEGQDRQVREFKLKHVRATEVQQQLQKLLGLDKSSTTAAANDPATLVQQMTQLIQKNAGAAGANAGGRGGPPPVYLVADPRDNSILVNAPVEQMAVITQAVRMLDTPQEKSRSLLRDNIQTQVYPLIVADPETVLSMLKELGDLEPATKLQVDRKRRAIVVQASISDQLRIRLLLDKVDGKARSFRVLRLQKVPADYVASAIDLVMGGGDGTKRP